MAENTRRSNPGKSAPLLLADIFIYNPCFNGPNALTSIPPHYLKGGAPRNLPPTFDGHIHQFGLKREQSVLLDRGRQDPSERCNVAVVCVRCRLHFNIALSYPEERDTKLSKWLCGPDNLDYPLHHFQYAPELSSPLRSVEAGSYDVRVFVCSAPCCFATVTITTRLPMVTSQELAWLVSKKRLQARHEEAVAVDPQWKTDPVRTPIEVLKTLCAYLSDAIAGKGREIPRENRRLLECCGHDHEDIFRRVHFKFIERTEDDEDTRYFWVAPEFGENRLNDIRWHDLTDIYNEILTQIVKYKPDENSFESADRPLRRLLVCDNFEKVKNRRTEELELRPPYYTTLGAMESFKDNIIAWCYETQKTRDPDNAPYYLECLANIATQRRSEDLQMALAQAKSRGDFSTGDVRQAYRALHLDPEREYEPDDILGKFRSFIADAPRQEGQMRQNLHMIGVHLHSQLLIQASQKVIVDIRQAYQYLGAGEHTDDHFILSLYQVKIKDNPEEESIAKDALRLIAETRMSGILAAFLDTGALYDQPLDIGMAYSRLDIPDRTLSDEMVIEIFNIRVTDGAVNVADLRDALKAIGDERNSDAIKAYLRTGESGSGGRQDWPVGLENIGNTCYLNSLLQYYFTIYPLRNMILQFDFYREELSESVLKMKRVGGRKLTTKEVERAQKFVSHLRTLFQNMISSQEASVTPEYDLAYLALVSSKDETREENGATVFEGLPPLITIVEATPPDDSTMDLDAETGPATSEEVHVIDDDGSEITLVEKLDSKQQDGDFVMIDEEEKKDLVVTEDKENRPPQSESSIVASGRSVLKDIDQNGDPQSDDDIPELITPPTPPPEKTNVPPPIPPRPSQKPAQQDTSLMFGRQQDVAECIENVMFQIEAAVKGVEFDENGEQEDLVKTLFYGKTKQSLQVIGSSESRHKTELFSHLLIDVAEGNRNIYSALDSVFDVTTVNLEGKDTVRYLSISHLPPVLQIQVQRVQFDRKSGRAYKSTSHLEFPETIYMDRYLDSSDADLQAKRQEAWGWKSEINSLEKRKTALINTSVDIEAPEALEGVREWIKVISESEDSDLVEDAVLIDICDKLECTQKSAEEELEEINDRLKVLKGKMSAQFSGLCKHAYRIHSVFIHRGSASFGHYWIYIYDFKEQIWRKYNDGYVTKVDNVNEVFNQDDVNPATPYFLVFVREDQMSIMEAVRREFGETSS